MTENLSNKMITEVVELAAKTALETYGAERRKDSRRRIDRRLRDTKLLLRNYTQIKLHAAEAVASLSELEQEDFDFFEELVERDEHIDVTAIVRSKARSAIMLTHINAMLHAYQKMCENSRQPEEQRRYRVLESMYLVEPHQTVNQIAEREGVDNRTVYKDIDAACEKMGALLFGIQWVDRV